MAHLDATLDTVRVTAREAPLGWRAEFDRRRADGFGTFLVIDRDDHRGKLSEILTSVPGLQVLPNGSVTTRHQGAACGAPRLIVDGAAYDRGSVDDFTPFEIAALEVYLGPASVPLEFGGSRSRCGVIVLWTRAAFAPARPDSAR
jgi:hypothetical protein